MSESKPGKRRTARSDPLLPQVGFAPSAAGDQSMPCLFRDNLADLAVDADPDLGGLVQCLVGDNVKRRDFALLPRAIHAVAAPRRRPLNEPFLAHARGQAGSRAISPAWLCISISAIAPEMPKLPSIWNGG